MSISQPSMEKLFSKVSNKMLNEQKNNKLQSKIAIFTLITFIPMSLFSAWVLTQLWLWFAVPFGVPSIGIAHAYGMTFLIHYFRLPGKESDIKLDDKKIVAKLTSIYAKPFILLFFGRICTLFMG